MRNQVAAKLQLNQVAAKYSIGPYAQAYTCVHVCTRILVCALSVYIYTCITIYVIMFQAAESLLAREKKLVDECDAKLVTARAAGATTCDTQCAAKVTSARQAAATACSSEWEAKTSSATIEWEAKMSRATIAATSAAATSAAVTTAHTECNTNTEKMRASHIAEVADATHAAEAAAASQKVEVVAAIENVLVCETQLQAEVKRCSSAGDEVEKCRKKMLECSLEQVCVRVCACEGERVRQRVIQCNRHTLCGCVCCKKRCKHIAKRDVFLPSPACAPAGD